ncbi:putative surface protein with fasciclin (FAS1) repeats [Aliiruegeria haliotis]|uniref:Putative surface protein with fasciclin (FAS1) repeats n=1 Tax=Aliiruegeria haliotis TaxID=1280846 RepID=A0A2T0RZL3_9RHOB|nr:fasciclin domain-containing protein [Aliiruegeria haliotis]PRY26619.1 putative surface protein with fasciclin (FAS1) repeats [Aliiruegeria haliotis]
MNMTITETVLASGGPGQFDRNGDDFDILLNAVVAAGLADTLNDKDGTFTVLAPNDDAFIGLSAALGGPSSEAGSLRVVTDLLTLLGGGDPIPLLTDVLTYHVAGAVAREADVVAAGEVQTLQGGVLELNLDTTPPSFIDADPGLPDPGLVATDIEASNGVIHVIDGVLLPVSVTGILGAEKTDLLIGGRDDDFFHGFMGDDLIDGNFGFDKLFGGKGNDTIAGGRQADVLRGNNGNDTLLGQVGFDTIFGGRGDDVIEGGRGIDTLTGGRGKDTFVFSENSARDVITDFQDGMDMIDLSALGLGGFDDLTIRENDNGVLIRTGGQGNLLLEGADGSNVTLSADDFMFA